jgi:hypothetical protein
MAEKILVIDENQNQGVHAIHGWFSKISEVLSYIFEDG